MSRVYKRLAPSIKVLLMVGSVLAVMGDLSPDSMMKFKCFVSWQSLVEEVAHLLGLMSICLIKATFMEHVIVVGVVFIVRMRCCDGVFCVILLEVSLFMSVTNSVSLDIILLRLRSRILEHAREVL